MRRFRVSLVAVMLLTIGSVEAQAQAQDSLPVKVFETVDSFSCFIGIYHTDDSIDGFAVEGVLQGDASASEVEFKLYKPQDYDTNRLAMSCQQMALLTMSTPGKYHFSVVGYESDSSPFVVKRCKLSRVNP